MDSKIATLVLELTLENSRLNKEVAALREQLALEKPKKISKPRTPKESTEPKAPKKTKGLDEETLIEVRKANGLRLAAHNKAKKEAAAKAALEIAEPEDTEEEIVSDED